MGIVLDQSLDSLLLKTNAVVEFLFFSLEVLQELNLLLNRGALVVEAFGEMVKVDRHEPQCGRRVPPIFDVP